ncbi:MAG: lipocalin-like domain-containing protein [Pseudoflavonifractor sp.]|nr:lipocalin-like domain-containing protein [Alloprevotella sp.]MCM1116231.1 lipocalin-like domain-containing protein [Pseudoflavonifractor sp.]
MRHLLYIALALAATAIGAGCTQMPMDGHLDGRWQLMSVDYPSGHTLCPDRCYYSFYRHTAALTSYGETNNTGNLRVWGDSLSIDFPWDYIWLGPWGMDVHTPYLAKFKVITLTRKDLVMLWRDSVTLTLRKF